MSDDVIIRAENIGKRYVLNHQTRGAAGQYRKLSDTLVHAAKAPLRLFQKEKVESGKQKGTEDFWALKDINFEIKRGEVVGIIGRNGAGKSTLLKILSRITEPTTGRITLRGRVASLLEVGTGFHPELTGRENIFLNGAILGMTKAEIRTKFDEIVAFAEIEKFLDTPVKRYSSGMYVRLAFAVAAHLEPEILIVDEVLAVGDQKFQQKCLGKMQDVASGGRTVLLVTHNMVITRQLCGAALLLDAGRLKSFGATESTVRQYETASENASTAFVPGTFHVKQWWRGTSATPAATRGHVYAEGMTAEFCFELNCPRALRLAKAGIHLRDTSNHLVVSLMIEPFDAPEGISHIHLSFDSLPVLPGSFRWQLGLVSAHELVMLESLSTELEVNTVSHVHPQPEWHPMINIPYRCSVAAAS